MIESHVIGFRASANIAPPTSAAHARMGAPSRALAELTETLKFHARVWTVCAQLQHRLREWLTAPARSIDGARVFHECDYHWPNTLRELGTPAWWGRGCSQIIAI
jgi:hypothetical protein